MTISEVQALLGWCLMINFVLLLWWWALLVMARGWLYRLHGRWFCLSESQFDAFHYGGIGVYKLLVLVFNLVPYLALRIMS